LNELSFFSTTRIAAKINPKNLTFFVPIRYALLRANAVEQFALSALQIVLLFRASKLDVLKVQEFLLIIALAHIERISHGINVEIIVPRKLIEIVHIHVVREQAKLPSVKSVKLLFLLDFEELLHCVQLDELLNGHVAAADAANELVVDDFDVDLFGAEGVEALVDADELDGVGVLIDVVGEALVHWVAAFRDVVRPGHFQRLFQRLLQTHDLPAHLVDEFRLLDVFLRFFYYFFGEEVEVFLQKFPLVFQLRVYLALLAQALMQLFLSVKGRALRRTALGR
jgi:hypothetical protein